MSENIKVLGVGSPIIDILVNVSDEFVNGIDGEKGGMVLVDAATLDGILAKTSGPDAKVPGGSAGNTIFGLAELGMPTSFLGKLGKDPDGDIYKNGLAELGGDTGAFCYNESVYTARCLSLVTPDSERTMRTDLGAAATITEEDVKPECFAGISHVHIEGYMLFAENIFRKIVEEAKKAGCTVSMDIASFEVVRAKKDVLPELLSNYVDIVFANEDEAHEYCGKIPLEEALEQLSELCSTAVVKMGKEGSIIKSKGETVKVRANVVDAIDTTGAGDLWQTGFLYGFLKGMPLEECGKYGSILGAEVVQVMGAKIPEKRWDEVKGQIK